ncbi:MAG: translation elongation factor Ts, partial [Gaiellales bacterium]
MSTPTISASQVKELRDQTGAGMMECKRALIEAGGDLEEARRLLRERGMAAAGKRAGRETTEGKVLTKVDERVGALVAVGCETEPVAQNDRFLAFARNLLDLVYEQGPEAAEQLEEERVQLVGLMGENIVVGGGGGGGGG